MRTSLPGPGNDRAHADRWNQRGDERRASRPGDPAALAAVSRPGGTDSSAREHNGDSSSGQSKPSPPRPAPGANCAATTTGTRKARDLGHRSTASAWTCGVPMPSQTDALSIRTDRGTSRGSSPRSRPPDPDLTRSRVTGPSTRRRPPCRRGSRRGRPNPTTRGAAGFPVDERHVDPSFELAELRSIATRRSHPDAISGPPATQCRSVPSTSDSSARD